MPPQQAITRGARRAVASASAAATKRRVASTYVDLATCARHASPMRSRPPAPRTRPSAAARSPASPPRNRSPVDPGTIRSGMQPTASLTTAGSPVASASLTTSPHVSRMLGSTRQSDAGYTRPRSRWFTNPAHATRAPTRSPSACAASRWSPSPATSSTADRPSAATALIASLSRLRPLILPTKSTTKSSGDNPYARRARVARGRAEVRRGHRGEEVVVDGVRRRIDARGGGAVGEQVRARTLADREVPHSARAARASSCATRDP